MYVSTHHVIYMYVSYEVRFNCFQLLLALIIRLSYEFTASGLMGGGLGCIYVYPVHTYPYPLTTALPPPPPPSSPRTLFCKHRQLEISTHTDQAGFGLK